MEVLRGAEGLFQALKGPVGIWSPPKMGARTLSEQDEGQSDLVEVLDKSVEYLVEFTLLPFIEDVVLV